ncbi:lamin tail domain-containing protein [Candidatus Poribacteria bacterium]|nr:lamin tail domain-containing protein [Candidatus Poribacteria bacterium]
MRLSNKSTFSLASLILLLALGFLYAVTPVMAHAPGSDERAHDHPLLETLPAQNLNPGTGPGQDEDTDDPGEAEVTAHNVHPIPVITLKRGQTNVRGNMIALDATTNTTFTLVVDYRTDVTTSATNTDTSTVADGDLAIGDAAHATLQVNSTAAADAGLAITRVADDASMFEVVVTPRLYPNADTTADTNDDTLTFRIQLPAGGLFSLQTTEIGTGVDPVTVPGGESLASALSVFTLVDALPELPPDPPEPDTTAPSFTVVTTPAGNTALTAGDPVQFTLTATEELGTGNNELLATNVEGTTNVTSMSFVRVSNTQYVVIVTPTDHTKPIVLTIAADAVFDTADTPNGNAEQTFTFTPADTVAPTVTITSAAGTGTDADKVVFTFTFSEALAAGSFTSADIDRTQSNVLLAGEPVMSTTDPKVYTLVVTPPATGSATIVLKTGSVMDIQDNVLEGDQSHTYIPPVPPGPATITAPAGGNVGNTTAGATITITFSKDPGTVTAAGVTLDGSGTTRTVTAGTASGSISLTWTGTDAGTSDDGSGTITYTIPAVPTVGPVSSANKLEGLVIPGKSFVLLTHADPEGLPETLSSDATVVWDDMPDLEALFYSGGSINITVPDVGNRSVLFTEFMWARNLAKVGTAGELAHQWIEIYNNNADDVTATVMTKAGRPALAHGTDRVSNVVGAGWKLEDLGQNGSDDGEGGSAEVDFVSMYKKNKSAGDKDGSNKGHWGVSSEVYLAYHKGTPGKFERSAVGTIGATSFNVGPIIFNEIANRNNGDKAYEWIELRNKSGGEVNLKNWQISIVTAVGQDNVFYDFPDADRKVPAGGLLLLVDTDPANDPNHPLQTGWNITKNAANQVNGVGAHSPRYMVADFKDDGLPDDGKFVLILRNRKDKRGKAEHLKDIAGYDDNLKVSAEDAGFTNLWPLKGGVRDAQLSNNKLEVNQVHRRQKDSIWGTSSTNYGRNGGNHGDDTAWRGVGWTSVGYKRNAARNSAHGGTPGFPNGAIKSDGGDAIAALVISEIMLDTSRNLPQWVEIQNLSSSIGVNLNNASLFIVNHHLKADGTDYTEGKLSERINIDNMEIPPNQTALVVSTGARSYTNLPNERVWNLRRGRGETLLNPNGFQITLKLKTNEGDANKHQTADVVGNLPDAPAGSRPDEQSYLDALWDWPAGTDANGNRVSVARKTSTKIMTLDGRSAGHWLSSMDDPRLSLIREHTYYGHSNDVSSPGQTVGTPLPVNLSTFRPILEDGKVVIHWTTESELDNAGFNIYRSEARDGEYKQVNTAGLIEGAGTTGERTTYEWVDQTAKPGVVYYYQIEDVSFAGERQALALTKLKGLISAKNKLTTRWGELKSQD